MNIQTFSTTLEKGTSKDVSGIVVPPEVIEALGKSKKPAVKVSLNGYTYRSTVAVMGGKFMIGLNKEHRASSGLVGNETLDVSLELDTELRTTEIPNDLKKALQNEKLLDAFEKCAPSHIKEFVRSVEEAKTQETRERRIAKVIEKVGAQK